MAGMSDNSSRYCDNISEKLAFYVALIRQENSKNMQSRNIRAEEFFKTFLNALKGWNLKNANEARQNAPGSDLVDENKRVIVQVSSTCDHEKIQKSLNKSDRPAYRGYHFYFMAITENVKIRADFEAPAGIEFNPKQDIFDTGKLLEAAQSAPIEQQEALSALVDRYFEADIGRSLRCLTRMPPKANKENVICRETELAEITKLIGEGKDVLLMSGFGGIGKTALARLVFHTLKGEYDEAAWVPYRGSLKNSMLAVIEVGEDVRDPEERWRRIQALKNDGLKKLFVIDNADADGNQDPQADDELAELSGWNDTTVIVTSRLEELEPYESLKIDSLKEDSCIELFNYYCKNDREQSQKAAVQDLVRLAEYHTLTIELFAKGARRASDLAAYCETLKKGFSSQKQKIRVAHNVKTGTIEEHLRILFNIQRRTRKEKRTLQVFALLPPNAELFPEEAAAWFRLDAGVLDRLAYDGWLRWNGRAYSAHPLVVRIVQMDRIPRRIAKPYLVFVEGYHNGYFPGDADYSELIRRLELAEAVCGDGDTVRHAHIFHNLGSTCRRLARYADAAEYDHKALAINEARLGTDHPDTAATYNNLALVYQDMGDLPRALEYHEKALTIREAKLGKDHPDTATTYNNLGALYYKMEQYSDACDLFLQALRVYLVKLGPGHPYARGTYTWLSDSYQALHGKADSFLPWLREQLNAKENRALDELLGQQ